MPWDKIGGWRKTKHSYLFSISDGGQSGGNREPFICRLRNDITDAKLNAIYFSERYGLVFGNGDFTINFDRIEKSQSKLG